MEIEHIVQDSCSDDGTQDWLPHDERVKAFIEKDSGMYDAVNRGLRRATGDIFAYLNCDEQYLPGALEAVSDFFSSHPEVDAVFADAIVTDKKGDYICHRFSLIPLESLLPIRFPVLTCSMFFRKRVVETLKVLFDTNWKALGDVIWVRDLLKANARVAVLRHFTSVFTETGDNLCLTPRAVEEMNKFSTMAPAWARRFSRAIVLHHGLRLLTSGAYFRRPFQYELYTLESTDRRVARQAKKPTGLWPGRRGSVQLEPQNQFSISDKPNQL